MRRFIAATMVIVALLALSAPALAGGWATVRLDEPPGELPAGTPWHFGFMVLQHDVTPNSDVTPVIRAVHRETGDEVTATAQQEGPVGHFAAELTLPTPGEWKWEIRPEPYAGTSFEALRVVDDTAPTTFDEKATAPSETNEIVIGDDFQPFSLEVAAGSTVTWINRSSIAHTVTGEDLTFDDSGLIEPGESHSAAFDTPGAYHYRCAPHPGMEGVIIVT